MSDISRNKANSFTEASILDLDLSISNDTVSSKFTKTELILIFEIVSFHFLYRDVFSLSILCCIFSPTYWLPMHNRNRILTAKSQSYQHQYH